MNRDWLEQARFQIAHSDPSELVARVVMVSGKTLFVFFAPLVVVANMWVFYALYNGIGLVITTGVSTLLFAGIFGYFDTQLTTVPHSQPRTLVWLYGTSSLVLNLIIFALV